MDNTFFLSYLVAITVLLFEAAGERAAFEGIKPKVFKRGFPFGLVFTDVEKRGGDRKESSDNSYDGTTPDFSLTQSIKLPTRVYTPG